MAATVCIGYCCIAMTTGSSVGGMSSVQCSFMCAVLCLAPPSLPTAQATQDCHNCIVEVSCGPSVLLLALLFDAFLSSNAASSKAESVLLAEACLSSSVAS